MNGLTTIELVIVAAIIAILAAVAYPQLRPDKLAGAARMMHGDLERARMLAISRKNNVRVIFPVVDENTDASEIRYKIHDDPNGDGMIDPEENVTIRHMGADFAGVSLSANRGAATFFPQGTSNSGTVTLTDGSDSRRVIFSWTGRVRIANGGS